MAATEAQVEHLRPKTVPENLIALGTVIAVSEIQIKLQLTGGIICLVDRLNISSAFNELLRSTTKQPRLEHYFSRGQQYACKIIEKRTRKGYAEAQDIIASIDPRVLQEDTLPATLLAIPFVPLQCAIQSIEDHGYQVDIGIKGITGFLPFEDQNDGKKFLIGQVLRCYLKKTMSPGDESRVVQLTMTESSKKKSEFSSEKVEQIALNEKCILPGSRSFLTVMNVKKTGLIVNFMNEFPGFVSANHLKDEWHTPKENYKISQQFDCTILYYNPLSKTFALSIRPESRVKKINKYLLEKCHVGQVIKSAETVAICDSKSIIFKVENNYKATANVIDALDEDVSILTKDELLTALDAKFPEGSKHKCRVKSINLVDQTLVVSLRKDYLELPFASVDEIKPGNFIEGQVKKIVKDGVIVTFGLNLRAIILDVNLNDVKTAKSYPIGKTIRCRVLKIDLHKQPARLFLTDKEPLMDPHITIVDSYDKSFIGESTQATVMKVSTQGLIVELFNKVKGFIPRIFMSNEGVAKTTIGSLFEIGQVVSCTVYSVDPIRPGMSLGLVPLAKILKMKRDKKELRKKKKLEKVKAKQESVEAEPVAKKANKVEPEPKTEDTEQKLIKSRRQRSEEAKLREEKLREAEKAMMDPNRPAQSIADFERLLLKSPNLADAWIKYSKFFLDNVETEKARIVCRRALRTINFRLEKEKLKIWLHLIKIEAKFGGADKLQETIDEAVQVNDKINLYKGAARVLSNCNELDESERMHNVLLKLDARSIDIWVNYLLFLFEHRRDPNQARTLFDKACKALVKSDIVTLKSRFAQFEFKFGDVERGKTMFENLLSDNPKRTDLWKVYGDMIKKFGTRQVDSDEVKERNEAILARIAESISLVSKKSRKSQQIKTNMSNGNHQAKRIKVV